MPVCVDSQKLHRAFKFPATGLVGTKAVFTIPLQCMWKIFCLLPVLGCVYTIMHLLSGFNLGRVKPHEIGEFEQVE